MAKDPLAVGDLVDYVYPVKGEAARRHHIFQVIGFRKNGSLELYPIAAHPMVIGWTTLWDDYPRPHHVRRIHILSAVKRGWMGRLRSPDPE